MKRAFLIIIAVLPGLTCCRGPIDTASKKPDYETVIIGGGLAGLNAAYELRDRNIILLEKEDRLGGRVWTKEVSGYTYELGALFGYTSRLLPEGFKEKEIIKEEKRIGFHLKDRLYLGESMKSAIIAALLEKDNAFNAEKISGMTSVEKMQTILPEEMMSVVKTAFNVIHPGDFKDYVDSRKMDAFISFATNYYAGGNRTLVDIYAAMIKEKYMTGAEVISVEKNKSSFLVKYLKDGVVKDVSAETVIVATPASVAVKIIKNMKMESEKFLRTIRYGKGVAAVFVTKKGDFPVFSYIVTPEKSFNTVFANRSKDGNTSVFTVYFIDSFINKNPELKEDGYLKTALNELRTMNIGNFDDENIIAKDVYFWKELGTVISGEAYTGFDPEVLEPVKGVVLAGDYTFWDALEMPYGIDAAFESGRIASEKVKKYLSSQPSKQKVRKNSLKMFDNRENLTLCTVYEMDERSPKFKEILYEGNIAYYGLIAMAEKNIKLAQKVAAVSTTDDQWEYGYGYGATSSDSAIVIESLVELGIEKEKTAGALKTIFEKYYDHENGCFATMSANSGRAEYWKGCSIETTAQIGYLLYKFDKNKYGAIAEKCAHYTSARMKRSGYWESRWFPSFMIPTYYAVRLLNLYGIYKDQLKRSSDYIKKSQKNDGSWNGSVIETSAAVLALKTIALEHSEIDKGLKYLQISDQGNVPEAVLYYWFELDGVKTFFNCVDLGMVADSWKKIAIDR